MGNSPVAERRAPLFCSRKEAGPVIAASITYKRSSTTATLNEPLAVGTAAPVLQESFSGS